MRYGEASAREFRLWLSHIKRDWRRTVGVYYCSQSPWGAGAARQHGAPVPQHDLEKRPVASLINFDDHRIGAGEPCFVIAEAGVNHNGDLDIARRLVDIAAEAGADAVKFQSFKAELVVSADAPMAEYQRETVGDAQSQIAMLRPLELSREQHLALSEHCTQRSILFLSSPFDEGSVDMLDELGMPVFKVASGEINNWPLLRRIAAKGKPIIMSTGMADMGEVAAALRVIRDSGNEEVVLLHCVSNYPADPADANLRAMGAMEAAFNVPVGYSDHTEGVSVSLAAVALGACVIEKHFTLDREMPGPDHAMSIDPTGLKQFVDGIRTVTAALGSGAKDVRPSEFIMRDIVRRSIVPTRNLEAGEVLDASLLKAVRPGTGLPPGMLDQVIGKRLKRRVSADQMLALEDLE